jgi:hypothetical protein
MCEYASRACVYLLGEQTLFQEKAESARHVWQMADELKATQSVLRFEKETTAKAAIALAQSRREAEEVRARSCLQARDF